MPFFEVVTLVRERRTYFIDAPDLDTAEERALEGDVMPYSVKVEDFGVNYLVRVGSSD
jgi:hypothetical protein